MLRVTDLLADQTVLRNGDAPAAPLVSVILPTYRRCDSGQLQRALQSVLAQTFEEFELLVMDDGSTDGSAELLENLRAKDPRVVHVRHDRNSGLPGLRVNEGIELARGRYLAFQFDDDVWRPNALETLVGAMERASEACVVVGKAVFNGPTGAWTLPAVDVNVVTLYEQNRIANNSVLLPRDLVERYGMYDCHIAMRRLTDWDLWLRYIKHVPFRVVDEVVSEVYESNVGAIGATVPWDLALFRYLHDIPRNAILTPSRWHDYEVDALRIGGVELKKDFRRRIYEDHVVPYYLRGRSSFPQVEGFRSALPAPAKTVMYTKCSYDVSNDVALGHFEPLTIRRGSYKSHFQLLGQVTSGWTAEADALLLVRVVEDEGKALAAQARAAGLPLGFYLDDDLLTFHEFGPQFDYLAPGTAYFENLVEMLRVADAVWVTNRFIARSVAPHNPRILTHSNCVPLEYVAADPRPRDPARSLRIAYAGSGYRREEFALIWDALRSVSAKYGERLCFEFWGIDVSRFPPLDSPVRQVPFTFSYFEYLARLRDSGIDIFLCPLLDHPTPRLGKSLIKYFEAAVAGAVGVFSDVPPYAALPEGLTCVKVANDAKRWEEALEALIKMPAVQLDEMRRRCVRHVRENYSNTALVDHHEAAWRATEFHALTRGQRHADGRPRVVYVLHSAHFGGGEVQLWRRLRLVREYGIEPIVVIPRILEETAEARRLAERLAREGMPLDFVDYTCFDTPRSPAEFCSEPERAEVRELLTRCAPALVHTVTFIPSFGQMCREMGIPHVASLYAVDDAFGWPDGSPGFAHCALNQSDSIRYARRWSALLGSEWYCAREVAPEECFSVGFERRLRWEEGHEPAWHGGPHRLVMAGTLQPRKRQAEAIEAVGRLHREGIDCRLDFYGYTHFFPEYYQRCRELVSAWGLEDRVRFQEFRSEVHGIWADAEIAVSVSTFESFPSAIKEAMAAGVLVVATPVGGIPELIIDGVTGLLCSDTSVDAVADGLRRATRLTPAEYQRIVEHARRVARAELHPNRAVNDLMDMYLGALEAVREPEMRRVAGSPDPGSAAQARGETVEPIGSPPLDYAPFRAGLLYRVVPRLARWNGIELCLGTPRREGVSGHLVFQIRLENGVVIREGATAFQARETGTWVRLAFPEIANSERHAFVLALRLDRPRQARVGLFECHRPRSLAERVARRVGTPRPPGDLFARLRYRR